MSKPYFAKELSELPTLQDVVSRSGLQLMQDIVDGDVSGPPIGETMGFWPVLAEDGKVVFEGKPEFKVLNPIGTVHGGWYGTILDSCMSCAVQTKLRQGQIYTTLEFKVNIIRPIPLGTTVHAIGTVHHVGRSTGIADGEIKGVEDGKLYATGSATCIIMDGPRPE
ncbi:PaaI family thioesterase [uncultured Shimia sp.]|uniref:PaaI family thioesterase n=1 Tax=uncultured Shimia sp. TaxID=573152 RepID=UPI002610C42D|nr:PaaI family thioesterase [uncultured Shimia sp.]